MANYRQIHVSIWKDSWFIDLEPDAKLLFIYLFSNELASLAGIYKIPIKVIAFETGLPLDYVVDCLKEFERAGKVFYQDGIVWIKKMREYNKGSAKVQTRIDADLDQIPDCDLKRNYLSYYCSQIPYRYPIDTLSTEEEMKGNEENLKGNEEEAAAPAAATSNGDAAATAVYTQVTGHLMIPGPLREKIEAEQTIRQILATQADPAGYLAPYWQEWQRRNYSPTNTAWLTSWAATGVIPPPKKQAEKPASQRSSGEAYAKTRQVTEEWLRSKNNGQ